MNNMAITGQEGSVKVGANSVAEIAEWSIDVSTDTAETTNFDGNGWKEYIATLSEWSGSITGNYDPSDTTGQKALINAFFNKTKVTLTLFVDKINNVKFSGDAYITSLPITVNVGDKVEFSCEFQGTGALAYDDGN